MPDDVKNPVLYEQDFYEWAGKQAEAIRAARSALTDRNVNDWRESLTELDWENLAEEIESLGRSERRELGRRIATVIEHLSKLEHSATKEPHAGWRETVRRSRAEIADILEDSPSLRRAVPELVQRSMAPTLRLVSLSFADRADATAAQRVLEAGYTHEQILDDWWPSTSP